VKVFAGSDDAWPDEGVIMNNITAPFWDSEFLKGRLQEGLERNQEAQFEQDWKLAETEAVRRLANAVGYPVSCRSARCRRARRCAGSEEPCKQLWERELNPAEMQQLIEKLYVRIQQERRAAAHEGRPPRVHDALTGLLFQSERRGWRSDHAVVVPANAGTHNLRLSDAEDVSHSGKQRATQ